MKRFKNCFLKYLSVSIKKNKINLPNKHKIAMNNNNLKIQL